MISVLLFDLDDTLFAHSAAVSTGIVTHTGSPGAAARWHELEEKHYPRYLRGEMDVWQQRRVRVREFLGAGLDDADADVWFGAYFAEYQRAWQLFEDTLPCLDALDGHPFGIITNGDAALQRVKLDAIGLTPRFEHVVASGALDFAKPDARIFVHACALFGVEPSAALYVGDRLRTDALGAAAAGLTGVWLDRAGAATPDELAEAQAAGVHVISSLNALPALVAGS